MPIPKHLQEFLTTKGFEKPHFKFATETADDSKEGNEGDKASEGGKGKGAVGKGKDKEMDYSEEPRPKPPEALKNRRQRYDSDDSM